MQTEAPFVRVTEIGEYIHYRSCARRFKLEANKRVEARRLPFAERLFNQIDPVLAEEGRKREDVWEQELLRSGLTNLTEHREQPEGDGAHPTWDAFCASLAQLSSGSDAYAREIEIGGHLGEFNVRGRIDFLVIRWEEARPILRIVECKASRRDRTYHRIQVCIYRMLVQQRLEERPITIAGNNLAVDDVECLVARIDEATNQSMSLLRSEPIGDMEMEEADILRLCAADGPLRGILDTELDRLPYQLDAKCDACVFNVDCLPESARQRRHELTGCSASTARALRAAGVATLDDLAMLDLDGATAAELRADPSFHEHLDQLQVLARVRTATLPSGEHDPDTYEVAPLPEAAQSQLPQHEQNGSRLIRVYLGVDYDYVENRVGALAAHVTRSDGQIHTGFVESDGRRTPNPRVTERIETGRDADDKVTSDERAVQGVDIVDFKRSPWSGDPGEDTGEERALIQGFIGRLIDAIHEVANGEEEAPVHFYVWSRSEMTQLLEGCARAHSGLLGAMRELMGCREATEQLIFSCLHDEVDRRFALGWTGRGLAVVTSLRWFGQTYHWTRLVNGRPVRLDDEFTQDIFDFKTDLTMAADGSWAPEGAAGLRHKFEIRSRFHDSLTAPYWRAVWDVLPDPNDRALKTDVRNAIQRYNRGAQPGRLHAYLQARANALRWVEERVRFKSDDIIKPPLQLNELRRFRLGVETTARAAIDFLQLDHHVRLTDWIAAHLVQPIARVATGRTIPVRDVVADGNGQLTATIDLDRYDIDIEALRVRCPFGEDSFVRLSPHFGDPRRGNTVGQLLKGGKTCVVDAIDWDAGVIRLSEMYARGDRYIVGSWTSDAGASFEHATIDESVSDYVAGIVERRLRAGAGAYVSDWFDPRDPRVPEEDALAAAEEERLRALVSSFEPTPGRRPSPDQTDAILHGLSTRVHLLQGPPGTGKTQTTAVALLTRILHDCQPGDVVLVAANTHRAIEELLLRLTSLREPFAAHARASGLAMPTVEVAKVHSSEIRDSLPGVHDIKSGACAEKIKEHSRQAVLISGGTTNAMLKMVAKFSTSARWKNVPNGFQTQLLVVDEASMMVFPHFLALATCVAADGRIMLAGDHRQLAPIIAHDWEHEDRPPAVAYQPFASAYVAVRDLAAHGRVSSAAVRCSKLELTFRLPPAIRELIARLYRLDEIELQGLAEVVGEPTEGESVDTGAGALSHVWDGEAGLFLVLHDERESRQSNAVEAAIIEEIVGLGGPLAEGTVAIITPHRAQRALLQSRFGPNVPAVGIIDTVERMQGGERPVIIVSGTASDPTVVSERAEFLLDLNRSNVAFSRAQRRLIVVCSGTLLDHIPPEQEQYAATMLWKSLRSLCSRHLGRTDLAGHRVDVYTPPVA